MDLLTSPIQKRGNLIFFETASFRGVLIFYQEKQNKIYVKSKS